MVTLTWFMEIDQKLLIWTFGFSLPKHRIIIIRIRYDETVLLLQTHLRIKVEVVKKVHVSEQNNNNYVMLPELARMLKWNHIQIAQPMSFSSIKI